MIESPPRLFRHPLDDCDVMDGLNLAFYREKRFEWAELLENDKIHSVYAQLTALLWSDAVFHLFNEMRKPGPTRVTSMTAPLLAEALDNGYVTNMVLGISRLTDAQFRGQDKGVVSLRRVFDDVRANRNIFTREVFVCGDGLRYDPATLPPPWERGYKPGQIHSVQIGGPLDSSTPTLLHERFDKLSGIAASARTRFDQVDENVFDRIKALLDAPAILKFRALRHKFVAHAADQYSRNAASLARLSITMADVEEALRALSRAYGIIQGEIFWASGGGLMPIAQFDVLEGLTEGLDESQIEGIQQTWSEIVRQREHWHE